MLRLCIFTTLSSFIFASYISASQLTEKEETLVCQIGLGAINYNSPTDYSFVKKTGDILLMKSKKYSDYSCEIFSDGQILTLSTPSWGRIKPTGNIKKNDNCILIKLYDPSLGIEHHLNSCDL